MKLPTHKPLLLLAVSTALILAFTTGYIAGSIRAARLENLNGQIDYMTLAFGVADALRTGKTNIVYPDSHSIVSSTYQGVTNDPWLRQKLLIPVVEWNTASAFPSVSFGVSDAARNLTAQAGNFLLETENESNQLTKTTRVP